MGRLYETHTPDLIAWIERQHLFFTATAPGDGGHVNCSPKGVDTLRVLDPLTVVYLDLTGSGAETIAHLRDNGRIVLMFCAFEGPPKILRIHGHGDVVPRGDARFKELLQHFLPLTPPFLASARSIVQIDIERIADSCGYGVPVMRYEGERRQLAEWTDNRLRKHGPDAIRQYQLEKNMVSIDHLPALDPIPQETDGKTALPMSIDSPQQSQQSHPGTPDIDP
jgi:hypothetical protein